MPENRDEASIAPRRPADPRIYREVWRSTISRNSNVEPEPVTEDTRGELRWAPVDGEVTMGAAESYERVAAVIVGRWTVAVNDPAWPPEPSQQRLWSSVRVSLEQQIQELRCEFLRAAELVVRRPDWCWRAYQQGVSDFIHAAKDTFYTVVDRTLIEEQAVQLLTRNYTSTIRHYRAAIVDQERNLFSTQSREFRINRIKARIQLLPVCYDGRCGVEFLVMNGRTRHPIIIAIIREGGPASRGVTEASGPTFVRTRFLSTDARYGLKVRRYRREVESPPPLETTSRERESPPSTSVYEVIVRERFNPSEVIT